MAQASVLTPITQDLSGSAHPERRSATLEALPRNDSAYLVPDEDLKSRPQQPLLRPSAVTSCVHDVGSGYPVTSTTLVVPPELTLEGTPQVEQQGIDMTIAAGHAKPAAAAEAKDPPGALAVKSGYPVTVAASRQSSLGCTTPPLGPRTEEGLVHSESLPGWSEHV